MSMRPITLPSTCRSPGPIRSPRIVMSVLMIEGTLETGLVSAVVDTDGLASGGDLAGDSVGCFWNITIRFWNMAICLEEVNGIARTAVDLDLVVKVDAGGPAGRADLADLLVERHRVARFDAEPAEMGVARHQAEAVIDLDQVAVFALPAGEAHRARGGGVDGAVARRPQVDAFVHGAEAAEGIDAVAEAVGHDDLGRRRCERHVHQHVAKRLQPVEPGGDSAHLAQLGGIQTQRLASPRHERTAARGVAVVAAHLDHAG